MLLKSESSEEQLIHAVTAFVTDLWGMGWLGRGALGFCIVMVGYIVYDWSRSDPSEPPPTESGPSDEGNA